MANVKVSSGNSKMGNITNINLPAGVTCRADAPCKAGCYALKGTYCYQNVKNRYAENLQCYLDDSEYYKVQLMKQLPLYGVVRWHSSGDIVDSRYFEIMVEIARKAKNVKFLAFTKKYEIVNDYLASGKRIPSNLKVVFSGWKGLEFDNPNNLPIAWMYDKNDIDDRIPKKAVKCGGGCATCMICWELKKGKSVVFNKH